MVEIEFPGTSDCWNSPLWSICHGRWLSEDELNAAILKVRGPVGEVLRTQHQILINASEHLEGATSASFATNASFEAIAALALLANLASNRRDLTLAESVRSSFVELLPELKRLPAICSKADAFFPNIGAIFDGVCAALRRVEAEAESDAKSLGALGHVVPTVPAVAVKAGVSNCVASQPWETTILCLKRYSSLPSQRQYSGILGILLLAALDSPAAEPKLIFTIALITSLVLLAVAVDQRVADYRSPLSS